MNNVKNNQGVTLTELMIVIVVMGIIALFAVPAVGNILESANKSDVINTSLQIEKGAELYCANNMSATGCSGDDVGFQYTASAWSTIAVDAAGALDGVAVAVVGTDNPGEYVSNWDDTYTVYLVKLDGTWKVSYYKDGDLSYGAPAAAAWTETDALDPTTDTGKDLVENWTA